jgi:O-antigen/teichoic acid export membrane protein
VASGVLLARLLGPEARGELAAVILWPVLIASLGSFGLSDAMTYAGAAQRITPRHLVGSAGALAIGLSLPLVIIAYYLVSIIFTNASPEVVGVAHFYVSIIPLMFLTSFLGSLFQGSLRLAQWNVLRVTVHIIYPVGLFLLWWSGNISVATCAGASLFANLLLLILIMVWVITNGWASLTPHMPTIRELFAYGVRVHASGVVQALNERLDQAILSLLLTPADLGNYVVALTVIRGGSIVSSTLQMVALPTIVNAEPPSEKAAIAVRYIRFNTLAAVVSGIGLAVLSPIIIRYAFGIDYLLSVPIAYVLILASLPMSAKSMINTTFKAYNTALQTSKAELVGLCAMTVSLPPLVRVFGSMGAAWALFLAQCFTCAIMLLWAGRLLGVNFSRLIRPTLEDFFWLSKKLGLR